jgi:hypothetical protein
MRTPARAKEWRDCTTEASDDFLHPIKDNDTCWLSIYLMLVRAIVLRNTITIFTAQNSTSAEDEKNLSACIMSREDWQYCPDVIGFMKPLYLLVKGLEGKPESGANGFVADVISLFDYKEEHLQLESFSLQNQLSIEQDGAPECSIGYINTLNAQLKLQKYKKKNTSVVLYAACVLIPWRK